MLIRFQATVRTPLLSVRLQWLLMTIDQTLLKWKSKYDQEINYPQLDKAKTLYECRCTAMNPKTTEQVSHQQPDLQVCKLKSRQFLAKCDAAILGNVAGVSFVVSC